MEGEEWIVSLGEMGSMYCAWEEGASLFGIIHVYAFTYDDSEPIRAFSYLWDGEVAEKNQLKNAFRTLGIRRVDHKSLEGCWL